MAPSSLPPHHTAKNPYRRILEIVATLAKSDSGTSWWWWWEIGAAILNLLGILLIIVLLFKIDETPLKSWTLLIQPSSLLSVLATISKTSLLVLVTSCIGQLKWRHFSLRPRPLDQIQLFDDASRGPWGSLIMMVKFLLEKRVWAFVATGLAFCNILALGIDPSAQQLIGLRIKEVQIADDRVLTSRAGALYRRTVDDRLNPDPYSDFEGAASQTFSNIKPYSDAEQSRQALSLEAIVYGSITGSAPRRFYSCPEPALRCAWQDFSTLGICGKVRNITDAVIQSCARQGGIGYSGVCDFSVHGVSNLTHKAINPISLIFGVKDDGISPSGGCVFNSTLIPTTSSVGSIWMVRVDNFDQSFDGTLYTTFESYILDFYYCHEGLHGVTASIEGFRVGSTTTTPWANTDGTHDEANLDWESNQDTIVPYWYNIDGEPRYNISFSAAQSITDIIVSLVGSPVYWLPGIGVTEHPEDAGFVPVISDSPTKTKVGKFLRTTDLGVFVNDLADALTTFILRPAGDNVNATLISGYMFFNEAYFEIRWPWLSVLVFETLLAVVLLAVTIFFTRGQPLLKNSVIALLVYTLSGWEDEGLQRPKPETSEKWEEFAEGMVALFSKDEKGKHMFKKVTRNA